MKMSDVENKLENIGLVSYLSVRLLSFAMVFVSSSYVHEVFSKT